MADSVGSRLRKARIARDITVEQAAFATKVRPERIVDLENDDYTNFPSITYAKGFLQLYAKFLEVDVSEFTTAWGRSNPIGTADYDYLSNAPDLPPPAPMREPRRPLRPLAVVASLVVAGILVTYLVMSIRRLGDFADRTQREEPEPSLVMPAAAEQPTPAPSPLADNPPAAPDALSEIPEQPIDPTAAAGAEDPPDVPATGREVSLRPLKKTWVKIQKDVPDSPPVFEDWLYPDAPPLELRGLKFWVEAESGSLEAKVDGRPVPGDGPVIVIQ